MKKRKLVPMPRRTKRELAARAVLVDAATEVACAMGGCLRAGRDGSLVLDLPLVEALNALYRANDEWQEAQLRGRQP